MPAALKSPAVVIAIALAIPIAALNFTATALLVGGEILQQFHAPVTSESLARSVSWEAESLFIDTGRCEFMGDVWGCDIVDARGSGSHKYVVEVEPDGSCWEATVIDHGGRIPAPKVLDGCVNHFEGGWYGKLVG